MAINHFGLLVLDLAGIFVFAIGGATLGVRRGLDLFGVLVLACVAATAGGIMRDVLIDATPPAAFQEWSYFVVACVAGLLVFWRAPIFERLNHPVQFFDAAGLALFAVAGASKALAFGLGPLPSVLMGMLTAVGGGMLRDILIAQVPHVLYKELYAVAALSGAAVVVAADVWGLTGLPSALVAGTLCFVLRCMGIRYGWRLPVSKRGDPAD